MYNFDLKKHDLLPLANLSFAMGALATPSCSEKGISLREEGI